MKSGILKIFITALPITLIGNLANGQDVLDPGKFGQTGSFGTARSIGFGGALGSVGGDFGSLSVNPAGIGIYRASEFMMTPGLRFSNSKSNYTGNETGDNNVRFGFNNLGGVFTEAASEKNYDKSDWKSGSFAVGFNRIADFSRTYNYGGRNTTSTASQYFEDDAFNYPSSTTDDEGTPAYLGYNSYLLSDNFYTLVPYAQGINQRKTVQEKGGITELAISAGGNYKDKLMIGATLGVDFLNHRSTSSMYEETLDPAVSDSFDNFIYNESYKTSGSGVNLKLGAIYKFNDYFRAGLAFHTPTIYSLTEISNNNISVQSQVFGTNTVLSPENQFEYTLITPLKTVASVTGMLGKYGFVSLDYELVSYGSMRYNIDGDKTLQNSLNASLKNLYSSASNIRAGIELRFDQLMVRGGYGYYGSPYKNQSYKSNRNDISFGMGYRFGQTFVDFAVINSNYTTKEQPYVLNGNFYQQPSLASIKNNLTTGVVTIGWKL